MKATLCHGIALVSLFAALPVFGQSAAAAADAAAISAVSESGLLNAVAVSSVRTDIPSALATSKPSVADLVAFKNSDVKFNLDDLVEILSDRRHEGWVLAAYPDPKTSQPLIGAGFSLDLPAREHPQSDPLNAHPFLEPASADLWQAAGLEPARLDAILADFHRNLAAWKKKKFRKKIPMLAAQITDEDAEKLVRIGAVQAAYNAKGYCRNFDRLTASQQMALSQLVYQMGVNLEEFTQFRTLINSDAVASSASAADAMAAPAVEATTDPDRAYWKSVQTSLIESQWARLYRTRAVAVIAMLDPTYMSDPQGAERSISAVLHPAASRHHKARGAAQLRQASLSGKSLHSARRKKARALRSN